jgi:hypothetical protein
LDEIKRLHELTVISEVAIVTPINHVVSG